MDIVVFVWTGGDVDVSRERECLHNAVKTNKTLHAGFPFWGTSHNSVGVKYETCLFPKGVCNEIGRFVPPWPFLDIM
jgi:hypothetical protein